MQLPFHCQWQDLKDLFRSAGQIVRADVAIGPDGRSRGYGTVLFATEADALKAVVIFNGCVCVFFFVILLSTIAWRLVPSLTLLFFWHNFIRS